MNPEVPLATPIQEIELVGEGQVSEVTNLITKGPHQIVAQGYHKIFYFWFCTSFTLLALLFSLFCGSTCHLKIH